MARLAYLHVLRQHAVLAEESCRGWPNRAPLPPESDWPVTSIAALFPHHAKGQGTPSSSWFHLLTRNIEQSPLMRTAR